MSGWRKALGIPFTDRRTLLLLVLASCLRKGSVFFDAPG